MGLGEEQQDYQVGLWLEFVSTSLFTHTRTQTGTF
jgi:hypothetical protein